MLLRALLLATLMFSSVSAQAHDTWFETLRPTERGEAVFALGTGDRFPRFEEAVRWETVTSAACGDTQGRGVALRWMADQPNRLLMRSTRALAANTALSCTVKLSPAQITLDNATVERYFAEARPSDELRALWQGLRDKGVAWQETYTKLARVMMSGNLASGDTSQGLDVRVLNTATVLRAGDTLHVQVLRDGQPLAAQMMEMRNDLSPVGIWRKSDDKGMVQFPLPLAAKWLLRGIDLRVSKTDSQRWESHFVTVALEVLPTAP